jgi:hypothetical protein
MNFMLVCVYLFLNSSVNFPFLRALTQCGSNARTGHLVVRPLPPPPRTTSCNDILSQEKNAGSLAAVSDFTDILPTPVFTYSTSDAESRPGAWRTSQPVEFGYPRSLRCMGPPTSPKFLIRTISDPLRFLKTWYYTARSHTHLVLSKYRACFSFKLDIARISFPLRSH